MTTDLLTPCTSPKLNAESKGYILVVDDEEHNRTLLRDPLEARGYEVAEAESSADALRELGQRLPDTILLDVMMPGVDGFGLCRHIKQDQRTTHIPVLMVTALSDRTERLMGIKAGANDFLNKPVDVEDLILRVKNAVHTKRLFDELEVERRKSDQLLLNILPKRIADRMRQGETVIADSYADVSVLVANLVGFTELSATIGPEQVVSILSEVFSMFDELVAKHGLEKIKTIGDGYMAVGGILDTAPDHTKAAAALGLDMIKATARFNSQYETSVRIRIGLNVGPVVAGVIGRRKFAYDLWGSTVNLAYHLDRLGQAGSFLVGEAAYQRLQPQYRFEATPLADHKLPMEIKAYKLIYD